MERDSVFQIGDVVYWNNHHFNRDDYPWYMGTLATIINVEELRQHDQLEGQWITHRVDVMCEDEAIERGLYPIRFDLHEVGKVSWEV